MNQRLGDQSRRFSTQSCSEATVGGVGGGQCAEGSAAPCCRAQEETGEDAGELEVKRTLKDEITRLTHIKASAKIRSV